MTITINQLPNGSYSVRINQDGRETVETASSRMAAVKCVLGHIWGSRASLVIRRAA